MWCQFGLSHDKIITSLTTNNQNYTIPYTLVPLTLVGSAMRASKSLLLSLGFSGHLSSSFSRRGRFSPRSLKKTKFGRPDDDTHVVLDLRGGQQLPIDSGDGGDGSGSTGSYHGNYVFQEGEEPSAASASAVAAAAVVAEVAVPPPPPTPLVLASATSTSSKLSNLQERTGPAILILGAVYLLLKLTGSNGLIGLVFIMQLALYSESTSVVEDFSGVIEGDVDISILKWWWFATAVMMTSGRCARNIATLYHHFYHT